MVWQPLERGKTMVGVPRFERGASCSQSKRSARLSYTPESGFKRSANPALKGSEVRGWRGGETRSE